MCLLQGGTGTEGPIGYQGSTVCNWMVIVDHKTWVDLDVLKYKRENQRK